MRWLLLGYRFGTALLLALALLAPAAGQESATETFPYVAYVAADGARVHAGPGNAHYATDTLSRGMKVEVLREISGWLAIRPPVGSFSWVPARHAELTDEPDVAMILADDVPAWIGTRVDLGADHSWQVQLNQGDHVKVLDVKRRPGAAGKVPESWYRIQPPAVELRFILAEDVTREESAVEELATTDEPTETSEESAPTPLSDVAASDAKPIDGADEEPSSEPIAEGEERSVLKAQFVPRGSSSRPRTARASTPAPRGNNEKTSPFKEVGNGAGRTESPRVASLDRLPATDAAVLLSASSRFEDKLTDIELQLSLMAARDPREWQLDPLHEQAERLITAGQTTLERGRARLVLDKIVQFEELYTKAVELHDLPRTAGITSVAADTSAGIIPVSATVKAPALTIPEGVTYDGVGWLKPVYSAKRVAPPYALVDADGKVLQYVTPAPGLNLNRYVKKPIGIFGQKSHLSEFNAAHLSAAKVVDLSKYQEK